MKKEVTTSKGPAPTVSTIENFLEMLKHTKTLSMEVRVESIRLSNGLIGNDNCPAEETKEEDPDKSEGVFKDAISILIDIQNNLNSVKYNMGRITTQ